MNLQFYLEKLHASEEFKKFLKENPSAFLCSAFFSIDKVGKDNKQHFDYFSKNQIFSFQIEDNFKKVPLENFEGKILPEISEKTDFDFDDIEKMIINKMREEGIKNELQKFLLSLQNVDEKTWISGTIFLSGMGMINLKIDLEKMKITDFEKKSIFDIMKVVKKK